MSTGIGWEIQSVEEALSRHFTYWFTSRRNQGKIMGSVPSFYYLFMKYNRTPDALVEKAQQEFDSYLGELFTQRTVRVTFKYINESRSLYTVQIDAQVISDGRVYDLGRTIETTGEHYRILDDERLKHV
jgi:hypothetical protein